jgi:hypothetical protein
MWLEQVSLNHFACSEGFKSFKYSIQYKALRFKGLSISNFILDEEDEEEDEDI